MTRMTHGPRTALFAAAAIVAILTTLPPTASSAANGEPEDESASFDARRAHFHWMLQCQGCHRPDATGSPGGAPNMAGEVARFLSVDGGREYLVRVPGVANAALDDAAVAELLNWMLATFDPAHRPDDFTPYTAEEVAALRPHVLVEDASARRAELIRAIKENTRSGEPDRKHGSRKE